jgi:hypothetical protein
MGGAPALADAGTRTSFTVDTQFVDGPSDIIAATGPLAVCTQVTDLENNGDQKSHNQIVFFGVKQLTCGTATVTVGYRAFITLPALQTDVIPAGGGYRTIGDWWVLASTLPGVSSGGGKLTGDNRTCTLDEGSFGCITDSFRGAVS